MLDLCQPVFLDVFHIPSYCSQFDVVPPFAGPSDSFAAGKFSITGPQKAGPIR